MRRILFLENMTQNKYIEQMLFLPSSLLAAFQRCCIPISNLLVTHSTSLLPQSLEEWREIAYNGDTDRCASANLRCIFK